MECLTGDHTPETAPRHNLVVTAPPYKTRESSTIAQKAAYFIQKYHANKVLFSFFATFRLFAPPGAPPPAWVSPGATRRCQGGLTVAPGHPARLQEAAPGAWMTRRAAGKGRLPIP